MQIYNVDLPGKDEFLASVNAHWFPHAQNVLLYKKYMKVVYDLDLNFNLTHEFDAVRDVKVIDHKTQQEKIIKMAVNDHNSAVFLAKQATGIRLFDRNGELLEKAPHPYQIGRVDIVYGNIFHVSYMPADSALKKEAGFQMSPMQLDYMNPTPIAAEQAFLERAKAAMILVQTAKEAGWTSINFGNTADPLERYFLKRACDFLSVDCTPEEIDPQSIPTNPAFNQQMSDIANKVFDVALKDILRSPIIRNADPARTTAPPPVADNDEVDIPGLAA